MLNAQSCDVETSLQVLVAMNTWVTSYHQKVKNNYLAATINKINNISSLKITLQSDLHPTEELGTY
jgi:hypothetical protein